MNSIFKQARLDTTEDVEEINPAFNFIKKHKQENVIPPIGIADPELVNSYMQNMEDEERIRKDVAAFENYKKESGLETTGREVLGHAARGLEGYLGGITSFLNMMIPPQTFEEESGDTETFQGEKLPGANELHEFTKSKTGKYLEPKNELSKASQETISDIGSMFSIPGLGLWQKILQPIGGQITKQIIKSSGGSEKAQDLGKLGFMMTSTIANLGNAPRVAAEAMNQARNMIPQGLRFSAQPTQQALNRIRNSPWFQTGRTASKGAAMDEITRIENAIQNGSLDAHEAMQLRTDINEARNQLGGFQLNRPVNRRQALRYLDEVDNALLQSMENYGQRVNPNWWNHYQRANEAYRITQRSRVISDFIQQNAKPLQSETAKVLFHVGAGAAGVKLPAIAMAAAPIAATGKSIQIMNRMIRSPILRNHYIDVLRQASSGNMAAMQKSLQKFDIASKKLEQKNSKKNRNPEKD
ncbi:hypothetical protein [Methylobacter sp.]|uniref:hypothetical protein n=1 Tax=Methylobacter sp. TaxID=2051955 RepID=UPI003DA679C0